MEITRRFFLRGLLAVPIVVGAPKLLVARPPLPREPYVKARQPVSYIGLALHPAPTFIGSQIVKSVGEWNGQFYPVVLDTGLFGSRREYETFPDHDLSDFLAELPQNFWHTCSTHEWPNVHSWVRHQRFGEHPSVMRAKLDRIFPWVLA